jgi:hypothetical protein
MKNMQAGQQESRHRVCRIRVSTPHAVGCATQPPSLVGSNKKPRCNKRGKSMYP